MTCETCQNIPTSRKGIKGFVMCWKFPDNDLMLYFFQDCTPACGLCPHIGITSNGTSRTFHSWLLTYEYMFFFYLTRWLCQPAMLPTTQAISRRFSAAAALLRSEIVIRVLWWAKWHRDMFYPSTAVSPAISHSTKCFPLYIYNYPGPVEYAE